VLICQSLLGVCHGRVNLWVQRNGGFLDYNHFRLAGDKTAAMDHPGIWTSHGVNKVLHLKLGTQNCVFYLMTGLRKGAGGQQWLVCRIADDKVAWVVIPWRKWVAVA
jgi:hypothetical protein